MIAQADGRVVAEEIQALKDVAISLSLSAEDVESMLNLRDSGTSLEAAYKVLGIPSTATDDEVKAAYRKMALKHHPDRVAKLGDYIDFDFTICNKDGDTLLSSFGDEPVEMQLGEEFISKGADEGLGMVPEGGTMRYVVPSELAFDSLGYQGMIAPYAPLVMTVKLNSIMDEAAYRKKQAALEAEKAAEAERKQALEQEMIANYIKDNAISEEPTESGLYIIRREEGEGNMAQWGEKVAVHYVLKTLKGMTVESSYDYDQPYEFTIGKNEMIPAIEEALMTMAPGAKVTLISPSKLAFGEVEVDPEMMPAYSPLLVELELVEIK